MIASKMKRSRQLLLHLLRSLGIDADAIRRRCAVMPKIKYNIRVSGMTKIWDVLDRFSQRGIWGAALFLSVFMLAYFEINEGDVFYHLRTGEYILENGALPFNDPFSFTAAGAPWVLHEWAFGVIIYSVYSVLGYAGITWFKCIIIGSAYLSAWRMTVREGGNPAWTFFFGVASAVALRFRFFTRPQIFTFVFIVLFLQILIRTEPKRKRRLLWLPLLMIPWANMHAACMAGFVLLGVHMAINLFVFFRRRIRKNPEAASYFRLTAWEALVFVLMVGASLINPNGMRIWTYPLKVKHLTGMVVIREWTAALNFNEFPFLVLLMVFAVAATLLMIKHLNIFLTICLAGSLVAAVLHIRHAEIFALVFIPATGIPFGRYVNPGRHKFTLSLYLHILLPAALSLLTLHAAFHTLWGENPRIYHPGAGLNRNIFPEELTDTAKKYGITGRCYNDAFYGNYIMFEWPGRPKVFQDGRTDVYAEFWSEIKDIPFHEITVRYDIQWALIDNLWAEHPVRDYFLNQKKNWALVYYSDYCLFFVKRDQGHGPIIHDLEMPFYRQDLRYDALSPENRSEALYQFNKRIRLDPDTVYNYAALSVLSLLDNDLETAEMSLDRAIRLDFHIPVPFLIKAELRIKQDRYEEALDALNAAEKRDAGKTAVNFTRAKAYIGMKKYPQALRLLEALVRKMPHDRLLLEMLIQVYEKNGQKKKASRLRETMPPQ